MSASEKPNRIPTSGNQVSLSQNPFAGLEAEGLPVAPVRSAASGEAGAGRSRREKKPGWRGRVDVRRESAGRGGKIVTAVDGFQKISKPEIEDMLREMQRKTGSGGTLKAGRIELQGDRVEAVLEILVTHGFRPVRAGG
ncbi:MAG: translation initiation factor [Opitutaceae bacterium]